ncbi:MAG: AMP-binding protein [Sulfurospirillaceae bacterium]|nr:AMP-binding protein [Sulfurospirillaceae bacterium]
MKVTPLENWIVERTHIAPKTQEALKEYQLKELIKILTYAKEKSRFYHKALNEIDVSSLASFTGFEQIPFTTPDDIKHNAYDFLCVSNKEVERIVTLNTSGTTGGEKRIFFTAQDLEATIDFFTHGMNCLVDQSDRVMVLLPGNAYGSIGDLLQKALAVSKIKCSVNGLLNDVEQVASRIEEEGITCLVGIPMQVLYLSKIKPELFQKHIKKVLLSTDYVPNVLVEALSKKECLVYNHYGMTEMGYGGGVECECLNGYHLRENHLYFEIVDPISGMCVKDGEYGEVVFTTLNRQAMPLIRYKTGDIARFSTKACACGTFLRTMEKVRGRMENTVHINQHTIQLRELDEILLRFDPVLDYTLRVRAKNAFHIKLILTNKKAYEALKEEIIQQLKKYFVFECDITLDVEEDDRSIKITNSMIKRKINIRDKG